MLLLAAAACLAVSVNAVKLNSNKIFYKTQHVSIQKESAEDLAMALTRSCHAIYSKISSKEQMLPLYGKYDDSSVGVVSEMVRHYNRTVTWIRRSIMYAKEVEDQLHIYKKFWDIMKICYDRKDYMTTLAIRCAVDYTKFGVIGYLGQLTKPQRLFREKMALFDKNTLDKIGEKAELCKDYTTIIPVEDLKNQMDAKLLEDYQDLRKDQTVKVGKVDPDKNTVGVEIWADGKHTEIVENVPKSILKAGYELKKEDHVFVYEYTDDFVIVKTLHGKRIPAKTHKIPREDWRTHFKLLKAEPFLPPINRLTNALKFCMEQAKQEAAEKKPHHAQGKDKTKIRREFAKEYAAYKHVDRIYQSMKSELPNYTLGNVNLDLVFQLERTLGHYARYDDEIHNVEDTIKERLNKLKEDVKEWLKNKFLQDRLYLGFGERRNNLWKGGSWGDRHFWISKSSQKDKYTLQMTKSKNGKDMPSKPIGFDRIEVVSLTDKHYRDGYLTCRLIQKKRMLKIKYETSRYIRIPTRDNIERSFNKNLEVAGLKLQL